MKLTFIARTVMEMCGPIQTDSLHDFEFDPEHLVFILQNIERREFNRVSDPYLTSKGLDTPEHFVKNNTGYAGMYLN